MALDDFCLNSNHSLTLRGLLSACLLLAAGCTVKDGVLTDFFTSDGTTTDGSTTGGATGTSATTTATGGLDVCEDPSVPVDEIGPAVAVTVRNAGAADIFVLGHGFCGDPVFTLHDADDNQVLTWIGADCPPMCEQVLEYDNCGCNDIGCTPGVVRIAPGGVFVDTWKGFRFDIVQPPVECVSESCAGQSCSIRRQTESAIYTVAARADSAFVCTIGDCACEPNAEGWCVVPDAELVPVTTVTAMLDYPNETAVELVFE